MLSIDNGTWRDLLAHMEHCCADTGEPAKAHGQTKAWKPVILSGAEYDALGFESTQTAGGYSSSRFLGRAIARYRQTGDVYKCKIEHKHGKRTGFVIKSAFKSRDRLTGKPVEAIAKVTVADPWIFAVVTTTAVETAGA